MDYKKRSNDQTICGNGYEIVQSKDIPLNINAVSASHTKAWNQSKLPVMNTDSTTYSHSTGAKFESTSSSSLSWL